MQIYRNTQWGGIKSCSFPLYLQCTSPQKHSAERPAGFFRWGVFLFAFKNRSYEGNRRTRESCRRLPALRLFPLLRGPCDGTIRVLSLSKRLTAVLPHLEGPASGADWRCFHSFRCPTRLSVESSRRTAARLSAYPTTGSISRRCATGCSA